MGTRATVGGVVAGALLAAAGIFAASAHGASTGTPAASTTTATSSPTSTSSPQKAHRPPEHAKADKGRPEMRGLQHGEWVSKDTSSGAFVTHRAVVGAVTSVSATSITVKAEDGVSLTFAVTADTKVRVRPGAGGKPADGKITDVKSGQRVMVTGTGKDSPTATHVVATAS